MTTKHKGAAAWQLFIAFSFIGLLAAACWIWAGEPWEVLADGKHYMAMYMGQPTAPPFAYRVLTPWLAHLLPWSPEFNFGVVTVACLSLATGFIALFAHQSGLPTRGVAVMCLLWVTSFAFVYYDTTRIRADAPMFLMMAVLFCVAKYGVSTLWLGIVLSIGCLSHETMLVGLAALCVDKLFSTNLMAGAKRHLVGLVALGATALALLFVVRHVVATVPAVDPSYIDGPRAMAQFTLNYSGGGVKHVLRIYAAFGPALVYALLFLASSTPSRERWGFGALFTLAVSATFLATDTLRVMAIVIVPVSFHAARFVERIWDQRGAPWAVALVAFQLAYAWLVYGHLRTFKGSHAMNVQAAALSGLSVAVALWALWRARSRTQGTLTRPHAQSVNRLRFGDRIRLVRPSSGTDTRKAAHGGLS
ncbi:MAG: hypothetical protein WAP57_11695 [Aquabacterium commune]|uniref:hypothetical protein n=1 Tax=Aquabacterium TaxID=92793 RepID=UPI001D7A12B5|nr:hypothetical protein [Aquabacterium sp.]MBT9609509.1 hypothetical protein [Aquabacterium sp.]|tara:strand:- start:482 stop:1738 length:1257 start_codon:yes stop_codon:yes gene_type:complete